MHGNEKKDKFVVICRDGALKKLTAGRKPFHVFHMAVNVV